MALRDTWFDVYARAQFGRALRASLALTLAIGLVLAVLLLPVLTLALTGLLAANGGPALTWAAAQAWLTSVPGLGLVLLTGALLFIAFCVGQAGLIHIAAGAGRGATPRWVDALATATAALPRLLRLGLRQAPVPAALLALTLLAAGQALVGTGWTAWAAGAAGALTLAALLALSARWLLALPVSLYEHGGGRAALTRAVALGRGQQRRALWLLALNLLLALAIAAGLLWLASAGLDALLGGLPPDLKLVNRTLLALALLLFLLLVLAFLFSAPSALVAMHLYLEVQRLDGLPATAWQGTARTLRMRGVGPALLIWCLLLLALGGVTMLSRAMTDDLRLDRPMLVVAHRGSSAAAPENTLSALYQAVTDGADMAEIDVQETADGVLVLLHDPDLRRVAGLTSNIWEVRYRDLKHVDVGRWFAPRFVNEPITTLAEALKVAEGRLGLNIELKYNGHDQRLADAAAELLRAAPCPRCIVTSQNPVALARIRALVPAVPVGLVVTEPFASLDELAVPVARARGLPAGALLELDLLSVDARLLSRELIRANRNAKRATHAWTVDDPLDMARLIDWGVDAIITNHPARLRQLLTERAGLSDRQRLLLTLGRQWGGGK